MREIEYPLVSIIIVNYNGESNIETCLRSVFNSRYPYFEVILVDNASTDNSLALVKKMFGNDNRLVLVRNNKNVGPAEGNNIGAKKARGRYIVFLNNDTEVDPNWLIELVNVMEQDPSIGAAGCLQLLFDDRERIDDVGGYLDHYGFVYPRCYRLEKNLEQYGIEEVFRYGTTALIVRKIVFESIGGFDSTYFMWYEDNDLCWRIRLAGYKIYSIPYAKVYHRVSATVKRVPKANTIYFNERNRIVTLIKNYSMDSLVKILPFLMSIEMIHMILHFIQRNVYNAVSIIKACIWVLSNFGDVWKRRLQVQRYVRKIPDKEITKYFVKRNFMEKVRCITSEK
ncbi:glycosyltransferase family 2 protein [Thermofilum sp.]|uniref:glycosyltransferase family 2 protein n=1 Tax=Thermofilum sp. TaxID=1961369 RepID=UPI00315E6497